MPTAPRPRPDRPEPGHGPERDPAAERPATRGGGDRDGAAPQPESAVPPATAPPGGRTRPAAPREDGRRRVLVEPGGPVLVEGPVEVVLPDGRTEVSDRFMVAVCACRRSRDYPWCDTSHRRRSGGGSAPGTPGGTPPERPSAAERPAEG